MANPAFIRPATVYQDTGLSRSAIFARQVEGTFPQWLTLGGQARGLTSQEWERLKAAWVAGVNKAELQALVADMHAARKSSEVAA